MKTKLYGGKSETKLQKCRLKYVATWEKLQKLTDSTVCALPRFVDNGDGTITDNLTDLVWEKKSRDGGIHHVTTFRTWSTGVPNYGDGTAFTDFLADGLNVPSFAGANDWRLPRLAELMTILLPEETPCSTNPCIDPIFIAGCTAGCSVTTCGCTSTGTWTSTTNLQFPTQAFTVDMSNGQTGSVGKTSNVDVRAVRGGF